MGMSLSKLQELVMDRRPGVLRFMGSKRVGYDWATELNWTGSSAGKDFACNAVDPGSIPGWGRSPGAGIGYPLQYSGASLVAQLVKSLPAIQETWVLFMGWKDPLEKGMPTHLSILAWRFASNGMYSPWGHKESDRTEWLLLTFTKELSSYSLNS